MNNLTYYFSESLIILAYLLGIMLSYNSVVVISITIMFPLAGLPTYSNLAIAISPYDSGYNHGCSDAASGGHPYLNSHPNHTPEFMDGYNSGYSACSSRSSVAPTPDTTNWKGTCESIRKYLLNDCSVYVDYSGGLTAEGQRAKDCIIGGGLLSGAGLIAHLPTLVIIGILERAAPMYNCDGLVNWAYIKSDILIASSFLRLLGVT